MISVMSGGYVYVKVPQRKIDQIIDLLVRNGIPRDRIIPDLHMTIMYDKSNPTVEVDMYNFGSITAWPESFKMLGPTQSEYLTIEMNSSSAAKLHDKLKLAGMVSSYPDFIPHMSLIKDPKEWEIAIVKTLEQNLLNQCISFDGPYWEPTKDGY